MLARRIAASAVTALAVAPAAANAAPIVRQVSEGPSATPLLVELGIVAAIAVVLAARKPAARLVRHAVDRLMRRRAPQPARLSER